MSSPILIARLVKNAAGFDDFVFSEKPFVHSTEHGAESAARALSRKYRSSFALFKRVSTVSVEDIETVPQEIFAIDELSRLLAESLRQNGFNVSNEKMLKLLDSSVNSTKPQSQVE